jgi:CPA2 family monovalent cation:H+ antiporter-2
VTRLVAADSTGEVLLLRILGLALLVAGAAEGVHVSAAVGAFLLGIALSGEAAELARPLLEPLRDLFAAVFFVFFGLSTDPAALPAVFLPALALVLVGIATKILTGWIAARRAGVGPAGRLRAGATLVPRGEFSIVIAGLAGSTVDPLLGPVAAAYVLLLAVIGPLMPRAIDPLAKRAARRARERAMATAAQTVGATA